MAKLVMGRFGFRLGWFVFIAASLALLIPSAQAQLAPPAPSPDANLLSSLQCLQVPKSLAAHVMALGLGHCQSSCKGCGCNGGPGYRGPPEPKAPKGKCVGFADINRICGPPPHQACTAECTHVQPDCLGHGRAWLAVHAVEKNLHLSWREADQPPVAAVPPALTPPTPAVPPARQASPRPRMDAGTGAVAQNSQNPLTFVQTGAPDSFKCGEKRTCKEMSSCAEAMFHHQHCGLTRLDGTGNGVPCKALCR